MSLAVAGTGHRPEMLRRETLANNARILIVLSALAMPFAVYGLVTGSAFPFAVAALALAGGMTSLALHQRRMFEEAAAALVYLMLVIGCILTLADHRLGDAGLAIAAMASIMASLVGRKELRVQSWILLGGVAALAGIVALFGAPVFSVSNNALMSTALAASAACMVIVAQAASRIGAAYEVYDKAQVTAYRHLIEHVQDGVMRFS
ncbi:MAG: hypothetical protein EOP02_31460 [Proteobacteria bacterium]|nr:MAG: hypothetical protein EOP02_31460 [Pseudomonadota bacterium]